MKTIQSTYNLLELGTRPFLLDLMVQELPNLVRTGTRISPATLYEEYVNEWFQRDQWRVLTNFEARLHLVQEIATYTLIEGRGNLTTKEVSEIVSLIMGKSFGISDLRDIEIDIQLCSFLDMSKGGLWMFSHRSFAEYFLARKLVRAISDSHEEQILFCLAVPSRAR